MINKHGKKWGFHSWCKGCKNKKTKEYYLENPEKRKENHLKRKYGITPEDKERMLKKQNFRCAICGEEIFLFGDLKNINKVAHVDHNHETREVRGLLCSDCNRGIGLLKDSPLILANALKYLENTEKVKELKMKKYQFKNKTLENALGVLYGEAYVVDQVERQMKDLTTSYIEFQSDDGSTTIAKGELEQIREDSHEPESA